jgi:hypothetical protein
MPEDKSSGTTTKRKRAVKRPAAKKAPSRKSTVKVSAAAAPAAAPPTTPAAVPVTGDRLTEVARTIGSTMGDIVAKTKKVLHRVPGTET